MSDLISVLLVLATFGFGWVAGFATGVWKAAKMQALREANQAQFNRASADIKRGTRIAQHIQPSRSWPRN